MDDIIMFDNSLTDLGALNAAINRDKIVYILDPAPVEKCYSVRLEVVGYKIGYRSYPRTPHEEKHPWDYTYSELRLERVEEYFPDFNNYDDLTPGAEVFEFEENWTVFERIDHWRKLLNDTTRWEIHCDYDDFCETCTDKKGLVSYCYKVLKENKLSRVYIAPKKDRKDIRDKSTNILCKFLNENPGFYSEWRGLEYD
jgi:hypothetical protein